MNVVERAIERAGGTRRLAAVLDISTVAVHYWKTKGRVPEKRCVAVSALTGIPVYELNSQAFRAPEQREQAA